MSASGQKHPAVRILEDLISIQSVNPFYGNGARGEGEIANYIEKRCRAAGLTVTRQSVFPGRDNLIVELRVGKPDKTLLFEAHMDTVSLGSMTDPLVPRIVDGRLYGRGACDTKSTLAGMLYMMEECAKRRDTIPSDLVFCASVDEEHEYRGLMALLDLNLPLAGAVVGEPTEMGIVVAHKGCARFAVRTHGKAAHSSVPHEGDNAIYQMMQVIRHIRERVEPALRKVEHPLCGSPSIAVGTIGGGSQINIVPEACEIEVDRRIIPGERPDRVLLEFERELGEALRDRGVTFTIRKLLLDWALDTPHESAVVRCSRAAAARLGLKPDLVGAPYGSDASKLQQLKGIPSIVYGPGSIAQAHSKDEWVPVREVEQAASFYLEVATTFPYEYESNGADDRR